jgi:hypothetical protein
METASYRYARIAPRVGTRIRIGRAGAGGIDGRKGISSAHNHRSESKTHLASGFAGLRWGTGSVRGLFDDIGLATRESTASCGAPVHRYISPRETLS